MKISQFSFVFLCMLTTAVRAEADLVEGSGEVSESDRSLNPEESQVRITDRPPSPTPSTPIHIQVRRVVSSFLPSLIKRYLDYHLPEFIQLHVNELLLSENIDISQVAQQRNKIRTLQGVVDRQTSVITGLGSRVRELEKLVLHLKDTQHGGVGGGSGGAHRRGKNYVLLEGTRDTAKEGFSVTQGDEARSPRADEVNTSGARKAWSPLDYGSSRMPLAVMKNVSRVICPTKFPLVRSQSELQPIPTSRPRLLAVSMDKSQLYMFDNSNKSKFPLKSRRIRTIVYDPTTGFIIWSNYSSSNPGIFSTKFRKPDRIRRYMRMTSNGLAIDPCKSLLIFTTVTPRCIIGTITTRGRNFRKIKNMKKFAPYMYSIALDTDSDLIYTCHQSGIVETSYDGSHQTELVAGGSSIFAVALDPDRRLLYYGAWGEIRVLSLDNGYNETLVRVGSAPRNLVYYGDVLYSDKGKYVQAYYIREKTLATWGRLRGVSVSICLVP